MESYHAEIAKTIQGLPIQVSSMCCSGVATHGKLHRTSVSALLTEAATIPNGMHLQANPYFQILLYYLG